MLETKGLFFYGVLCLAWGWLAIALGSTTLGFVLLGVGFGLVTIK